jgi:hypothetical protein
MNILLTSLENTDFQTIIESEEISHIDNFIKENASQYKFD